jgi:hypothetical protein
MRVDGRLHRVSARILPFPTLTYGSGGHGGDNTYGLHNAASDM